MSTTLSTAAMVTQVQKRVQIGLSATMVLEDLNASYRWLCQRGPMVWLVKTASVSITGNLFDCPTDFDAGRPAVLSNPATFHEIPFVSMEEAFKHQKYFTDVGIPMGGGLDFWSVWTYAMKPAGAVYQGMLLPMSIPANALSFSLRYHSTPATLTSGSSTYFPSPDVFDTMFVDLAESEARRKYGMAGWQDVAKKAMDSALAVIDQYHSTRLTTAGATEKARKANEKQAIKAI